MSGPVQGVTVVQALLLRTSLPDLPLHDGASFLARVASRGEQGKASLVIAGELIAAQVPDEVQQGQTLRLTVAEVTPERITLRMDAMTAPAAAASPAPPPPPPQITVDERASGGRGGRGGEAAVTLTYRSAALGTLRLRVATAPGVVAATVQVPQGLLEAAQAGAERLRAGLAAQTGRTAAVHVAPGSVDVRA